MVKNLVYKRKKVLSLKSKFWVFFLALITDRAVAEITKNVTVLIPPAVPTGEPPINMSNIQMSVEGTVRDSCGTEAKPAVRVVTD